MKSSPALTRIVSGWLLAAALAIGAVTILQSIHIQNVQAQAIPWPHGPWTPTNVSFASTAAQTLVAGYTAGGVCVYELSLTNAGSTATTISVYLDGGTTAVSSTYLQASGGNASWAMQTNGMYPWFLTNATVGFVVKSSANTQINGSVYAANCP